MSSKFEVTFQNGILFIKLLQKLAFDEVKQLIVKLASDYDYRYRLWDLSLFDDDFTLVELQHYAILGEEILTEPGAIALYCKSDLLYGEMRQYSAVRGQNEALSLAVFRDYHEAVEWLQKKRSD